MISIIHVVLILLFTVLVATTNVEGPQTHLYHDLRSCLSSKQVPVSLSTSDDWNSTTAAYNLRLQYTPAAVTLPTTLQHVSDSVTCAAELSIKVQPRSGGHSYGSYSLGGKNGSLVVDLRKFNSISLNTTTGIATVGGGARLGNLGVAIFNQGQRALPHGTFPGVGIGGHYTHGGFGYSSRRWGLALGTIVAMDVVLADGSFVHATPSDSPDIYYAMRGSADSFGITTTFYLQTQPAPARIVSFDSDFASSLKSPDTAADILLKLQTFVTTSTLVDRNLTLEIYINVFGNFSVRGWYFGKQDHFAETLLPAMLDEMSKPANTTVKEMDWLTALKDIAEGEPLIEPPTGYNNHQTFYTKSVVTREAEPLTRAALTSFFEYVAEKGLSASHPWNTYISLYGGRDSQINVPEADSAAYSHRDSLWVFQNIASTADFLPPWSPEITTFVNGLNTALTAAQPDGDFQAYPNYLDPNLTPAEAARLYFGSATYNKLVGIKHRVDSKAVFWNPQAIGNAAV